LATISRGGHTNSWTVAATVSPNVSGGFEKRGLGTLIVDKVCSYTGITRVSGGTLKLGVDAAIDASSGITLSGGTLDADSKSFNVPVCGGYGNVIGADIVRMTDDMVFDSGHLLSGSSIFVDGVVSIPDGATVSVRDFGAVEHTTKRKFKIIAATGGIAGDIPSIDVELAKDGWSIVVSPDGKEMFVYKPKGLKVIFR
jgi:autotransporter-associated beta strand protein